MRARLPLREKKKSARVLLLLVTAVCAALIFFLESRVTAQDRESANADGEWVEIGNSGSGGGISDNSTESRTPSLVFGSDGMPIVAWMDLVGENYEVYVKRWNGAAWVEMGSGSASGGGISSNSGASRVPSLVIGSDGAPIIAWNDDTSGNYEIYVRRWNGAAWVEMGSGSTTGGGISKNSSGSYGPRLVINSNGTPIIAWHDESDGDNEIYVRRWNGTTWVEMGNASASGGGISDNVGRSSSPSLAAAPDGTPYIAWEDDTGGIDDIYVRRWNGAAWDEVGNDSASGNGISVTSGDSRYPSMALSASGTPIVAWFDNTSGFSEIYVMRWNGVSWTEMGSDSAQGGGISNNPGSSLYPSLAISPENFPVIAWHDYSGGTAEVYVRHWNGGAWVEMGSGSADGGGISNLGGDSIAGWPPSLAFKRDGSPAAAWYGKTDEDWEIFLRQWQSEERERFVYLPVGLSGYSNVVYMKGNQEQEPNDKWHQANGAIRSGTVYHGAFSRSGDASDYFYFYLAQAGGVTAELSDIPAGNNYDLVLRDSDLKEAGYSGELNNDDETIIENLPSGLYFIQVYNRDGGTSFGQYALQVDYGG